MGSLRNLMAFGAVALAVGWATPAPAQETKQKIPPAGYAMTSPKADFVAYVDDSTSISRNANSACVTYIYRTADGSARGKSVCPGRGEYFSLGEWSVRDDGAFCYSWKNAAWNSNCSA